MTSHSPHEHHHHHDHRDHGEGGHDRHAGHSPEMFRDRFWLSLVLVSERDGARSIERTNEALGIQSELF